MARTRSYGVSTTEMRVSCFPTATPPCTRGLQKVRGNVWGKALRGFRNFCTNIERLVGPRPRHSTGRCLGLTGLCGPRPELHPGSTCLSVGSPGQAGEGQGSGEIGPGYSRPHRTAVTLRRAGCSPPGEACVPQPGLVPPVWQRRSLAGHTVRERPSRRAACPHPCPFQHCRPRSTTRLFPGAARLHLGPPGQKDAP